MKISNDNKKFRKRLQKMKMSQIKQIYNNLKEPNKIHGGHIPSAKEKFAEIRFDRAVKQLGEATFKELGINISSMDELTIPQRLSVSARLLGKHGHACGITGQFTTRGPRPNTMWTQVLGYSMEELTPEHFILVDYDLNVLEGDGNPNPANIYHIDLYKRRPDIQSICHTHSLYCSALSMKKEPLTVAHVDTCSLFNDFAYLDSWPGLPFSYNEGELVADYLGDKRGIFMANHGFVATGLNVEHACFIAYCMEETAKLQLTAMGGLHSNDVIRKLNYEHGMEAHSFFDSQSSYMITWYYLLRSAYRQYKDFKIL